MTKNKRGKSFRIIRIEEKITQLFTNNFHLSKFFFIFRSSHSLAFAALILSWSKIRAFFAHCPTTSQRKRKLNLLWTLFVWLFLPFAALPFVCRSFPFSFSFCACRKCCRQTARAMKMKILRVEEFSEMKEKEFESDLPICAYDSPNETNCGNFFFASLVFLRADKAVEINWTWTRIFVSSTLNSFLSLFDSFVVIVMFHLYGFVIQIGNQMQTDMNFSEPFLDYLFWNVKSVFSYLLLHVLYEL